MRLLAVILWALPLLLVVAYPFVLIFGVSKNVRKEYLKEKKLHGLLMLIIYVTFAVAIIYNFIDSISDYIFWGL